MYVYNIENWCKKAMDSSLFNSASPLEAGGVATNVQFTIHASVMWFIQPFVPVGYNAMEHSR